MNVVQQVMLGQMLQEVDACCDWLSKESAARLSFGRPTSGIVSPPRVSTKPQKTSSATPTKVVSNGTQSNGHVPNPTVVKAESTSVSKSTKSPVVQSAPAPSPRNSVIPKVGVGVEPVNALKGSATISRSSAMAGLPTQPSPSTPWWQVNRGLPNTVTNTFR